MNWYLQVTRQQSHQMSNNDFKINSVVLSSGMGPYYLKCIEYSFKSIAKVRPNIFVGNFDGLYLNGVDSEVIKGIGKVCMYIHVPQFSVCDDLFLFRGLMSKVKVFKLVIKKKKNYCISHYFRVQLFSRFWTFAVIREWLISRFFWCCHYYK